MNKFKYLYFLLSICAWALSHGALAANAPRFELDKAWPRLPENFRFGDVSSIAIDAQDNVWVLHRPRTLQGEAAKQAAPAIVIFDNAGNYLRSWGGDAKSGEGFEWPQREHGILIDGEGVVQDIDGVADVKLRDLSEGELASADLTLDARAIPFRIPRTLDLVLNKKEGRSCRSGRFVL